MKPIKRSIYWEVSKVRSAVVPEPYRFIDAYVLKASHTVHDHELYMARERRLSRMRFLRNIKEMAEGGKIAIIESGMDCDGVQYAGKVYIVDATKSVVEEYIDKCYEWADGPMYFSLERPSVANEIEYRSRDLALEAFEDGHPHSLHPHTDL